MTIAKRIFNFYINSSIHVALSCFALVRMTQFMFQIPENNYIAFFAFFGTVCGYNFVKYDAVARVGKRQLSSQLKAIAGMSFIAFVIAAYCFFKFDFTTQISGFLFFALIVLYTLPFFPNRKNARNWAGVKIYMVALCWVGITLILPVVESGIVMTSDFYIKCIQRFCLIFILILVFEIIDLKTDDPHLKTVPQQIGVKWTKIVGLLLLIPFYFLEFFKIQINQDQLLINAVLGVIISLSIVFAKETKSRYYSVFWVEMIPVLWYALVLFFG